MNKRLLVGLCVTGCLAVVGCSSDERESVRSEVESAASEVGEAAGEALDDVTEAAVRNFAAQQGEEQFTNAGHALSGPLTCEATVADGVDSVDVNCTGTTAAGGAAVLTGTTSEIPGASLVALTGTFVGTVDGAEVFRVEQLGG